MSKTSDAYIEQAIAIFFEAAKRMTVVVLLGAVAIRAFVAPVGVFVVICLWGLLTWSAFIQMQQWLFSIHDQRSSSPKREFLEAVGLAAVYLLLSTLALVTLDALLATEIGSTIRWGRGPLFGGS